MSKTPIPSWLRLWGVAHMDYGIVYSAETRRECVEWMGYVGQPLRNSYANGVYYYHAREGGHDVFIGRVHDLMAAGFAWALTRLELEPAGHTQNGEG